MSVPRFSVVVPTRQRADTLRQTLLTCLAQDFDDYEIIVCDNCSTAETKRVVDELASPRITYLRSSVPLAMSANWELAVARAQGEYVTVLGDDDGLMPYALRELDALIKCHAASIIHWQRGMYTWPCYPIAEDAHVLRFPIVRELSWEDGHAQIMRVAEFKAGFDTLPMIYNSVIRRDLISKLRGVVGCLFPSTSPDVYSGFAFAYLAKTFLSVSVPMNIAGLSGHSNGVANLVLRAQTAIVKDFEELNKGNAIRFPAWVPDLKSSPIAIADGFLSARERLFPNDSWLVMDRRKMIKEIMNAEESAAPADRREVREKIRATLRDDAALLGWFDAQPTPPPAPRWSPRPAAYGNDGRYLVLHADQFGVANIADAVRCIANVLCLQGGKIQYNLPAIFNLPSTTSIAVPLPAKQQVHQRITREIHRLVDQGTKLVRWSMRRAS